MKEDFIRVNNRINTPIIAQMKKRVNTQGFEKVLRFRKKNDF